MAQDIKPFKTIEEQIAILEGIRKYLRARVFQLIGQRSNYLHTLLS